MSDLIDALRRRDEIVRTHHERKSGRPQPKPFTLEGIAADEIERLTRERDEARAKYDRIAALCEAWDADAGGDAYDTLAAIEAIVDEQQGANTQDDK